ncbi:MAG: efflux RND transporter permease subunit [Planctomycetota bacterium]
MNEIIRIAIHQPITMAVGVLLAVLAGLVALDRVPIQMTPEIEDTVIAVRTTWESASPQEIETQVIDQQEQVLQNVGGVTSMTSLSQSGAGQIRLQFRTGTDKQAALQEVSQKLDEVPSYPEGVNQPEIEDTDPESRDYIAWITIVSSDPDFDIAELGDFVENQIVPQFERLPGMSEVNVLGGREKELQVRVDMDALAQRGITMQTFVDAVRNNNRNASGGTLEDGKVDIRIRALGRFTDPGQAEQIVVTHDENGGPVYVRDVATVTEGYKERTDFCYVRGMPCIAINFQKESGANVLEVIDELDAVVARINGPGGLLQVEAERRGINGTFEAVKTYDQTGYINDALALVQSNIYLGGGLAVITLLLFLRSLRSVGIIALAIPISVIGSIVVLVAAGRSVNVVSLAGLAFAIGMVVDNAIVVLENIYRHLEMGKKATKAAFDGTSEVAGAVLASTLTTLIVFIPILLIQESAGQLFRDIALAICSAVALSYVVSITVIPSLGGLLLKPQKRDPNKKAWCDRCEHDDPKASKLKLMAKAIERGRRAICSVTRIGAKAPTAVGGLVYKLTGSVPLRLGVAGVFLVICTVGSWLLLPPLDYLPAGNRNIVFGVMIPPPGYNQTQFASIAQRLDDNMEPFYAASEPKFALEPQEEPIDERTEVTYFDPETNEPAGQVTPPPADFYFVVNFDQRLFHAAITGGEAKARTVDMVPLFNEVASADSVPGVYHFPFQLPLFRTGGTTGSAVKLDLSGANLDEVSAAAGALFGKLVDEFGPTAIQPEPANFNLLSPELHVNPNYFRLTDAGLTGLDHQYAVAAAGDGLLVPDSYEAEGELKDLKIISARTADENTLGPIADIPLASGFDNTIVTLGSVSDIERTAGVEQIKRVGRQRAVTLQVTPPAGVPLANAMTTMQAAIDELRADGTIADGVQTDLAGSAGKLNEIKTALLGDGSVTGTLRSTLFLALVVVYLLMCVLFQSWTYPLVIVTSVPLATFGGFLALWLMHQWSLADRYMPVQNLDVLTILGFVILAGVVVNNAILIVHQTLNFTSGKSDIAEQTEGAEEPCSAGCNTRDAIRAAVESRVRPIMMSTLTSVGGMLPLVLMPGSGSELYRGLGAVVTGGLIVSTVFTLILVPVLLSLVLDAQSAIASKRAEKAEKPEAIPAAPSTA